MAVVLPPGVQVEFELPAYSILPSSEDPDVQPLIVAALSTFHFPEARQQFLQLVNKGVSGYHYQPPPQRPNRSQRRRMGIK